MKPIYYLLKVLLWGVIAAIPLSLKAHSAGPEGLPAGFDSDKLCDSLSHAVRSGEDIDFERLVRDLHCFRHQYEAEGNARAKELYPIYEQLGNYYSSKQFDYSRAIHMAHKHLTLAEQQKDSAQEVAALLRLSRVHFFSLDSIGLAQNRQAYELSLALGDTTLIYKTVSNLAKYLNELGYYTEALSCLDDAVGYVEVLNRQRKRPYLYALFSDVYMNMGNESEAFNYIEKALVPEDRTSRYDRLYVKYLHAKLLYRTGRYKESIAVLDEAFRMQACWKIMIFDHYLLRLLASNQEALGQYREALDNLQQSYAQADSTFQKERQYAMQSFELKHEILTWREENNRQKLALANKKNEQTLLYSIILLLTVIIAFVAFISYKGKKREQQLVRMHLASIETEKRLRQQAEQRHGNSSLTEERSNDMFRMLEAKMLQEKVFCDPHLSIDRLAQLLGTNRSYLSQVVNEQYGQSYSAYVNHYRIEEAIMKLSDPGNTSSLKEIAAECGFNSSTSFFTLFKKATGVSPSTFREHANA